MFCPSKAPLQTTSHEYNVAGQTNREYLSPKQNKKYHKRVLIERAKKSNF